MFFRKPANVKGPRRHDRLQARPEKELAVEPRRALSVAEGQILLRSSRLALHKAVTHRAYLRGIDRGLIEANLRDPAQLVEATALAHGPRAFPRYEFQFALSRRRRLKVVGMLVGREFHVEAASVVSARVY